MFQSRSPRYPVRFDAVIDDGEQSLSAPVINLSDTGLFVETTAGFSHGTRVRIIPLTPEPNRLSEFEGEVVRLQDPVLTGGVKRAPGIAVRFVHLLAPDKHRLRDFCRRALDGGTANDDGDDSRLTKTMPPQSRPRPAIPPRSVLSVAPTSAGLNVPVASTKKSVDELVDMSAAASLLEDDDHDSTLVQAAIQSAQEQSENDFFAKGESLIDDMALDDGDHADGGDLSNVRAAKTNPPLASSFLAPDVDSVVGGSVADSLAVDDEAATALFVAEQATEAEVPLEPYVYSDQLPKSRAGVGQWWKKFVTQKHARDDVEMPSVPEAKGRTFGGPLVLGGLGAALVIVAWAQGAAFDGQQRAFGTVESEVYGVAGEVARNGAQVVRLTNALDTLRQANAQRAAALDVPVIDAMATSSPLGDGSSALIEARFSFKNPAVTSIDVGFSRTRVFTKEVAPRAMGQAPLALESPLDKAARGWTEIVDDTARSETADVEKFEFARATKKRFAKAPATLHAIAPGQTSTSEHRWVVTAAKPTVVAVVHEWMVMPRATDEGGTAAKVHQAVRMVGIAGAPAKARR